MRNSGRGCDADWFREAFQDKGIRACIPGRNKRKTAVKYDKRRYKRRNRIEIMFGRLKDWRRVATRYDRCPKVLLSAIALAALVICRFCTLTLGCTAEMLPEDHRADCEQAKPSEGLRNPTETAADIAAND